MGEIFSNYTFTVGGVSTMGISADTNGGDTNNVRNTER